MSYTNATVVIKASEQSLAQQDFPDSFTSGFYEDVEPTNPYIATFFVCSGLWSDDDLSKVTNDVQWQRKVYFGDAQGILASLGLKPVEVLSEQVLEQAPEQSVQPNQPA